MTDLGFDNLVRGGFDAMQVLQAAGQTRPQREARAQQEAQRARVARVAQLSGRALNGDQQAKQELAFADPDFFLKMDKETYERAAKDNEALGNAALLATDPQKWDQAVRNYINMGHPEAQQFLGRFDLRDTVLATAGKAQQELARIAPKWTQVGERGVFDANDPAAVEAMKRGTAGLMSGGVPTAPVGKLTPIDGGASPQGGATFPLR